jgi:hypothetical protein
MRYAVQGVHTADAEESVLAHIATYIDVCEQAHLDALIVISQLLMETDKLRGRAASPYLQWLRLPPIGRPSPSASRAWRKAARAHAGLVLAFAIPLREETAAQHALIKEGLSQRAVPEELRGSAPTLRSLVGTWSPRADYADSIRHVANEILMPQY